VRSASIQRFHVLLVNNAREEFLVSFSLACIHRHLLDWCSRWFGGQVSQRHSSARIRIRCLAAKFYCLWTSPRWRLLCAGSLGD